MHGWSIFLFLIFSIPNPTISQSFLNSPFEFDTQDYSTSSGSSPSTTENPDLEPQNGYHLNGEIVLPLIVASTSSINPLPMSSLLTSNGKDVAIPVIINKLSCLYPSNPDPLTCLLQGPELIVPFIQTSSTPNPITNLSTETVLVKIVKSNANFIQVTSSIYLLYGEVITPTFIPTSHLSNYSMNPFLFSTSNDCLTPVLVSSSASFNASAAFLTMNNNSFDQNTGFTPGLSNGYTFNGETIIPLIISANSVLNPYPSSDLLTPAYGEDVAIPMMIKGNSCLSPYLNQSLSPNCTPRAPEMIVPTLVSTTEINLPGLINKERKFVLVTRILSSQTNLAKESSYELEKESINSMFAPWPSAKSLNPFLSHSNATAQSLTPLLIGCSAAALPKTKNIFLAKEKVRWKQRLENKLADTGTEEGGDGDDGLAGDSRDIEVSSLSSLWNNWGIKIGTFGAIIIMLWLCLLSLYCSCICGKRKRRRLSPAPLASLYSRNGRLEPPPPVVYY